MARCRGNRCTRGAGGRGAYRVSFDRGARCPPSRRRGGCPASRARDPPRSPSRAESELPLAPALRGSSPHKERQDGFVILALYAAPRVPRRAGFPAKTAHARLTEDAIARDQFRRHERLALDTTHAGALLFLRLLAREFRLGAPDDPDSDASTIRPRALPAKLRAESWPCAAEIEAA